MQLFWIIITYICILAVVPTYQQSCPVADDMDIQDENTISLNNRQVGECCGLCSQNPPCVAYAWNDFEGGTCWLKKATFLLISNPGVSIGILTGSGGGNGGNLVSQDEFHNSLTALGYPAPTVEQYNSFIQGIPTGHITTKEETAMALTHFTWESDGLRAKREYACASNGSYVTPDCDAAGQTYYGRGYIQLSWCPNYEAASASIFGDNRLVWDSDQVALDENTAWNTAFWFWATNVHSLPGVAQGRLGVTTRAINGALECDGAFQDTARHRYAMYKTIRGVFNLPGDGDETGCYD